MYTDSQKISDNLFNEDHYDFPIVKSYESSEIDSHSVLERTQTTTQIDLVEENYETLNHNHTNIYSDLNHNRADIYFDSNVKPTPVNNSINRCWYKARWCWQIFLTLICTLVIITAIVIIILVTTSI